MSLSIEAEGARALIAALQRVHGGKQLTEAEAQGVLSANAFFVDYYCRWSGVDRAGLAELLRGLGRAERPPANRVLQALRAGWQRAAADPIPLRERLASLQQAGLESLAARVLPHLPPETPLHSTIHLTVDAFNGGFQFRGEMGLSLLLDLSDPAVFEPLLAHELHHVGFRYWAERDSRRQALLAEGSCRAVAVRHVQNLLLEGLAIHYCSPFPPPGDAVAEAQSPYRARLASYRRNEFALFAESEQVLRLCLAPDAELAACEEAAGRIAIDLEGIEPAGHYLGARQVQIMAGACPHERIIACIRSLGDFLPSYNEAAQHLGAFAYNADLVARFRQLVSVR